MAGKDEYKAPEHENILYQSMEEVLPNSMMPYAEHVILERALPRVEDGLKPVQRRVLYVMYEQGLTPDKPFRKSANIVGETMAKYHPHGDSSIYETMVRMAQDFNMRAILVAGHGNFGSIDGDPAAAFRYTEARLSPIALELLRDIEKDTVKWSLNFDDTRKEPDVLPGRFPNLLVNGSSGIAVGLATNIPTQNLAEVIDGVIAQMENPRITLKEMMKIIKGPDFPTGGTIINGSEIENAYATGRGKLLVRAKTTIENAANGKKLIVINELPYQVNKARMLENILKLREEKKGILSQISDIRDESDRNGMRAVIELKKDAEVPKILSYLYKYSDLQVTFGVNMVAIAEGKPQQLSLLELNRYYIEHQKDVERKRVRHDLDEARAREEILNGLVIAIKNIDKVIKIIRSSPTVKVARERLRETFELSERQATAILEMRLQRLTGLEIEMLEKELAEVRALIKELEEILNSKTKLMDVIKKNLLDIKRRYKDPRRTIIMNEETPVEVKQEDFKVIEEAVVSIDKAGYFRRVSLKNYTLSNKDGLPEKSEEILTAIINTKTDESLLLFSNLGNCYSIAVEKIPECKWRDKGAAPARLLPDFAPEESIISAFAYNILPSGLLYFCTKNGMVKCSDFSEYNIKKTKYSAISLKDGDKVLSVSAAKDGGSILFITKEGMSLNIEKSEVPVTGRVTGGVKGIALDANDYCIFAKQIDDEGEVLVWSEKGYAKRSLSADYDLQVRNRKGLKTFDFKKNGSNGSEIVGAFHVKEPFDMLLVHSSGTIEQINTEIIFIEARLSGGKPYSLTVMGDNIIGASEIVK